MCRRIVAQRFSRASLESEFHQEEANEKERQFLAAANNKKISREKPRGIIVLNRSIDRNVAVTPPTFRFVVAKRRGEKTPLFLFVLSPRTKMMQSRNSHVEHVAGTADNFSCVCYARNSRRNSVETLCSINYSLLLIRDVNTIFKIVQDSSYQEKCLEFKMHCRTNVILRYYFDERYFLTTSS